MLIGVKGRRRKPLVRLGSYKPTTFRWWVVDSRLKSIMGIKVGEIARAFYPATKRKFFELKEFYIIDDTMNVTCYDLDAELFAFSFPIKMFDMSTEEIENYTIQLFADQIKKYRENLEDKKKELKEKEKEVNASKQKISDLEQVCQAKEY